MDINKYAFFAKTAELKNLSAAAEYLGYTQSAASHIISSLEKELGFAVKSPVLFLLENWGLHFSHAHVMEWS